ncbi:MAG: tetraacyldisaccharide 4'-kinase [Verrucomicrobia bacterium]|nr:tetraacyldisaccharide 4'-kinase [Verrucomicrobiota bacterium]MBU6445786.1 tetraacyldisaccharide 4'-kinase [Verrucomicrobiota bacterium]MDE3047584.1 tetraacyldisaccharide 4'-kinase [Verrucomicrobiota bacterium]
MLRDDVRLLGQRWVAANLWFLAPFSWLYAALVFVRNRLYDWKLFPITRVPCTVVSIGNIVAGGSGKTPFTLMLASAFSHRKVAILSRTYGAISDEALLLARRLPQVQVFTCKNRAKMAAQIAPDFDLILLDDGFQHRKLHRDVDIVLVRPEKHYLPWGFLRDSPSRLQYADAIFSQEDLQLTVHRILDLKGNPIPSIAGWKMALFCGIARPERFKKTVVSLGAIVTAEKIFADHALIDISELPQAEAYICTEKDAVKLPPTHLPIYYLEMRMQTPSLEKLVEKIDQKIDNRRRL